MNNKLLWSAIIILLLIVFLPNIITIINGPKLERLDRHAKIRGKIKKLPTRFAKVSNHIYRGGQPNTEDLIKLNKMGITTIINLRKESISEINREKNMSDALGIQTLPYPSYSLTGMSMTMLDAIMADIKYQIGKGNVIYVHCKNGRDRTSTICALYKVLFHNVDPQVAWQEQALDFDHQQDNIIYWGFYKSYCKYLRRKGYQL